MDEVLKFYNNKMNDMDKYSKTARDLEAKGNNKEAKYYKEKAQSYIPDIKKAMEYRERQNNRLIK